jgi:protein O-GlcNAc transferase
MVQGKSMASGKPDIPDLFSRALLLQQEGKVKDAAPLYRRILAADPDHFDSHHMLGLIHASEGDLVEGARSMGHAVRLRPRDEAALSNLGNVLKVMGQLNEALLFQETALTVNQNAPGIWYNRGLVLFEMRRLQDALASFDQAIVLMGGSYPEAQLSRAAALRDLGRLEDGLAGAEAVLVAKPDWAEALKLRGTLLWRLKRPDAALDSFNLALEIEPRSADTLHYRALALAVMGRPGDALASYDAALALNPGDAEVWNNRGNALASLQRYDEALKSFDRATGIQPGHAGALNNRGATLVAQQRFAEAVAAHDEVLKTDPSNGMALFNRAVALSHLERFQEALVGFETVLAVHPRHRYALSSAAQAALNVCDWKKVAQYKDRLLAALHDKSAALSPFILLGYGAAPAAQRACGEDHLADLRLVCSGPWVGPLPAGEKRRIAYVSADFGAHPVGYRLLELARRHDRSRFELHAIMLGSDDGSPARKALAQAFDHFHQVDLKSGAEIAALMRQLGIAVAVDLGGYTQGGRPEIFARRSAPVQVNYLGWPATSGSPCLDYIIADAVVAPRAEQDAYSEAIVHLPGSFFPAGPVPDLGPAPSRQEAGLPESGIVFGCFHQSWKIGQDLFEVWMRLLHQVEGSILWLNNAPPDVRARLEQEAEGRGVSSARLVWAPEVSFEKHMARLQLADMLLDTLPYNAHSSAADALAAGVPVITCRGENFAGRVAASLLRAAGLGETVAAGLAGYEQAALGLARDPAALAAAKAKLAAGQAALFDIDGYVRNLETAYQQMWEQAGTAPVGFSID